MAKDNTISDMAKLSRRVHGPRPIASLVPVVARKAFALAAPGAAQLMEAWPAIVGQSLADATVPRRLVQGTLTVACSGPVAMELRYLSIDLIGRVNQYLGAEAVKRLRFVQSLPARPPLRPRPQASAALEKAAAEAVSDLPEGPLHDALVALGRAVITESASRLGKQPSTKS